jgi:hypothetical protein
MVLEKNWTFFDVVRGSWKQSKFFLVQSEEQNDQVKQ